MVLRVANGNGGSGSSTFAGLSDASTANVPVLNAPTAAALALKAGALTRTPLTANHTVVTADGGTVFDNTGSTPIVITVPDGHGLAFPGFFGTSHSGTGGITVVTTGAQNILNNPGVSPAQYLVDIVALAPGSTSQWTYEPDVAAGAPLTVTLSIPSGAPSTVIGTLSRAAYQGTLPAAAAFVFTVNGTARTTTALAWTDATHFTATYNGTAIAFGQTATATYTESATVRIVSLDNSSALQSFTAATVTNGVSGGTTKVLSNNTGADYPGPTKIASLQQSSPTIVFDFTGGSPMEISIYSAGNRKVGAFFFSLSALITAMGAGRTIVSCTFSLYKTGDTSVGDHYALYRLLKAINFPTWNTTDGSTAWSTAGAQGSGTDRGATAESTHTTTSATGAYVDMDCTAWFTAVYGGATNFGLLVDRTDVGGDTHIFDVVTGSGANGQLPKLTVVYS